MSQRNLLADAGLDPETPDGLVDFLDPRGYFEPERWVFEQLSLQMSVVNRCGDLCPGMPQAVSEPREASTEVSVDPRWQALKDLQSSLQTDGGDHD